MQQCDNRVREADKRPGAQKEEDIVVRDVVHHDREYTLPLVAWIALAAVASIVGYLIRGWL